MVVVRIMEAQWKGGMGPEAGAGKGGGKEASSSASWSASSAVSAMLDLRLGPRTCSLGPASVSSTLMPAVVTGAGEPSTAEAGARTSTGSDQLAHSVSFGGEQVLRRAGGNGIRLLARDAVTQSLDLELSIRAGGGADSTADMVLHGSVDLAQIALQPRLFLRARVPVEGDGGVEGTVSVALTLRPFVRVP